MRGRDVCDLLTTAALPDSFEIVAAGVVTFVAEWRCFVVRGEVLDARRYGVTKDDRTLVVEVNDGYSLGHDGLAALRSARLLEARRQELCAAG